jgi:hypothetical protein
VAETLKNSLARLWSMYEDRTLLEEKVRNAQFFQSLFRNKNKFDKNNTNLLADVKQWMDVSKNHVLQRNMSKIKQSHEEIVCR